MPTRLSEQVREAADLHREALACGAALSAQYQREHLATLEGWARQMETIEELYYAQALKSDRLREIAEDLRAQLQQFKVAAGYRPPHPAPAQETNSGGPKLVIDNTRTPAPAPETGGRSHG